MPTVSINGLEIHYREAGQGFPVVLIHGFTGNLRNWALVIPALTQRYRTVSPDLRGHGQSGKPTRPEDYSLELMAEDVYGLLRHLDIDRCYLVGHSMGGMVAQSLVLTYPGPVQALALVDTAATVPEGMRTAERARLVQIAQEEGMEAVFEAQLDMNPMAQQLQEHPELLQLWRRQFLMTSREAYIYCAQAIANRRPLLEELPSLSVPTLIVCGENDEPFVAPSRQMHERIAGSQLAYIPGCGHTPQVEKPDQFNRILLEFLARADQAVTAQRGA